MTKVKAPQRTRVRYTAIAIVLSLLFLLFLGGLALWHSGALLSHVTVMQTGGQKVDAAVYTVCYKDTLAALAEEKADEQNPDLDAEARKQCEETLSRALVFLALAEREGKLSEYDSYAAAAGERATKILREQAAAHGKSEKAYLAERYGRGIDADDVARTAAFFAAASLREQEFSHKIYTAEEREAAFEAHRTELLLADCIVYSVKVQLNPSATPDEMRDAYLSAESRAQALAATEGEEAFLTAMQQDYREMNPTVTTEALKAMTKAAYRYGIRSTDRGLAEQWVRETGRAAGDTAVLGANGDYTVVYCLTPAVKCTEDTANIWQMLFPVASEADREAAYEEARALLDAMNGTEAFRQRAENFGDATLLENTWRAELVPEVVDWLSRSPAVDESALVETEDAFLLVCFDSVGTLSVWEKQAVGILQDGEYRSLHEAAAIRTSSFARLFLLI